MISMSQEQSLFKMYENTNLFWNLLSISSLPLFERHVISSTRHFVKPTLQTHTSCTRKHLVELGPFGTLVST